MNFDLDKTLYMFTAGRYEFSNKGGDFFIESLARLNHMLKVSESGVLVRTVVARVRGLAKSCCHSVGLQTGRVCVCKANLMCMNSDGLAACAVLSAFISRTQSN